MRIKRLKIGLGCHLVVNVLVNKEPARFLIDTGASRTMLDAKAISKYCEADVVVDMAMAMAGIGGVTTEVNEVQIKKFQIGNIIIEHYKFLMSPLDSINKQYQSFGLKNIHGILGADILCEARANIDLLKNEITFQ